MRFYPKRLANMEALEREKQLLKSELKQHDLHSILSVGGFLGVEKNKKESNSSANADNKGNALFEGIAALLPFSGIITRFVSLLLQKAGQKAGKAGIKAGRNVLGIAAKEVVGGYVKWKAFELAGKGVLHFFKSRKEHNKENPEKEK